MAADATPGALYPARCNEGRLHKKYYEWGDYMQPTDFDITAEFLTDFFSEFFEFYISSVSWGFLFFGFVFGFLFFFFLDWLIEFIINKIYDYKERKKGDSDV